MNEEQFRAKHGEKIFQINNVACNMPGTSIDQIKNEDWFRAIDYLITETTKIVNETKILLEQALTRDERYELLLHLLEGDNRIKAKFKRMAESMKETTQLMKHFEEI